MRAFDPEVVDTVWAAIEPLLPVHAETRPLGCHRPRVPDRDCFEVMLVRLVAGCSWEDAERLCGNKVSDTTARARRGEWIEAGVFDAVASEAVGGYDKIVGLDLSDVAVDGSLHKSPAGGEGTGKNPTDRAKLGWKWSVLTDARGIPIAWTVDAANCNDSVLLVPTLNGAAERDCSTTSRRSGSTGATTPMPPARLKDLGINDAVIAKRRQPGASAPTKNPHGPAMAGRADQLVALELWQPATQHGPHDQAPLGPNRPGRHLLAHGQAHRLAEPAVTGRGPYPLELLPAPVPTCATGRRSRPSC